MTSNKFTVTSVDNSSVPETDERFDKIVAYVEQLHDCQFIEIMGFERGTFSDKRTDESVDSIGFALSFFKADEYFRANMMLLNGTFAGGHRNFCSGWLTFEDDKYPEIRFIRHSGELIFTDTQGVELRLPRINEEQFGTRWIITPLQ